MGFSEAVRTCLFEKYVTFSGRASRSEFWYFNLFYILTIIALVMLFLLVGGALSSLDTGDFSGLAWIPAILALLFILGTLLPLISVTVRRFHDRNLSGWWYLAVIIVGSIPALEVVGYLANIAVLIVALMKGTPGANRFGRDPLGADSNADVFA